MIALPSYIDPELFAGYIEMRHAVAKKDKRKVFTQYAEKLVVMSLMRFHSEGFDPNDSLSKAIKNSWTDVYRADRYPSQPPGQVDPALAKILADEKKAAPMPDFVRQMKERMK